MRHRKKTIKLGRTSSHRKAMLRNMVCSLIMHETIQTTKAKAKAARILADKVVNLAIKSKDTAARRRVFQLLDNKEAVKHLFDEVAGRFSKNTGGYTRILACGNNLGDNAEKVVFQLSYDVSEKDEKKSTMRFHFKKKKGDKDTKPAKAEKAEAAPAEEAPAEEAPAEEAAADEAAEEAEAPAEAEEAEEGTAEDK